MFPKFFGGGWIPSLAIHHLGPKGLFDATLFHFALYIFVLNSSNLSQEA